MCINVKCNHYFDGKKMKKMAQEYMRQVFGVVYLIFSQFGYEHNCYQYFKCQFSFNKTEVLCSLVLSIKRLLKTILLLIKSFK